MQQTFLWHDYETFGLSPAKDRPAQFAAVRTDDQMDPIGEAMCWYCRPSMDYLPNPQSIQITGILPQACEEKGVTEAQFARRINAEMSKENTISIGYNSMRFDDEVSRFMFWRNFQDVYGREWKDGCGRYDLFPLVLATWALRPEGINWPMNEEGKVSFKLENLSKANGLTHEHAHDALSDVYATIGLAKLIKTKQPRLWDYAFANRTKKDVTKLLEAAKNTTPLLWVSMFFGAKNGFMKLVAPLATHPTQPNTVLMWDLAYDPKLLLELTPEEVQARLFVSDEDREQGVERLPIYLCKINQAPFLVHKLGVLRDERAAQFGLDKHQAMKHFEALQPMLEPLMGLWAEALGEEKDFERQPIDEALYGEGFATYNDQRKIQWIGRQSGEALANLVQSGRAVFDNERLATMLFRYRARNWPETLTSEESQEWRAYCHSRLMEGADGALTLEAFAEAIEAMADVEEMDEHTEELCGALYDWCERVSNALDD